jgi:hypothetical protein
MGLITGFIEGIITYNDGAAKALPFQDKIEGVTFNYSSESLFVETFGANGLKGTSEACPYRETCSFELRSKNLAWSFFQAATNTLARDAELTTNQTYSVVLSADDITASVATLDVTWTPAAGTDVIVSDVLGIQYPATFSAGSPNTLEIGDVTTPAVAGTKVTINYKEAASGTNNEIALGSGSKIGEIGVYGRFFGCPDSYLIQSNRGIIDSNLSFDLETDAATAAMTITCLRDANENFAVIKRL